MLKKISVISSLVLSIMSFAQDNGMKNDSKFSIIASGGYGRRLASTPDNISPEEKDYINQLKNGINADFTFYYHFPNSSSALGAKYSDFTASSKSKFTVTDPSNYNSIISLSTKDNIRFIGLAYMFSNFNENTKHKLFYDLSLGVITYITKTGSVTGRGSNLGAEMNFGYQYAITKDFFLGPKISMTAGTLKSMTFNGKEVKFADDQKEGLHRISIGASGTFRF